jgi:hypothetical protein
VAVSELALLLGARHEQRHPGVLSGRGASKNRVPWSGPGAAAPGERGV